MNRTRGAPPGARQQLDLLIFGLSIATVLWIVVTEQGEPDACDRTGTESRKRHIA